MYPNPLQFDLARQLAACQANSRRNGKVARLPQAVRDQINQMIDDGVPYKLMIEKLGLAAQHFTEHNLSNWRLGGYQDYLKAQAIKDRARIQTEAAADLVRDSSGLDAAKLRQACGQLALLQYFRTVAENGGQLARESLKKNPAKLITLINALCNMSNSNLAIQKQKCKISQALANEPSPASQQPQPAAASATAPQPSDAPCSAQASPDADFPPRN